MRGLVIAAVVLVGCGGTQVEPQTPVSNPETAQSSKPETASPADADFPPAVLSGEAELQCTISSSSNGHQTLRLTSGQGLEFDAVVSPIVDGVVEAHGPEHGGSYRFTSHLVDGAKGTLSGVGAISLDTLETKVNVAMDRYKQPGGPGTELSFEAADMAARGIYVEFTGRALAENGESYAFRVTLGAPGAGSGGKVVPSSNAYRSNVVQKMVTIEAPQTTVVSTIPALATVQKLK